MKSELLAHLSFLDDIECRSRSKSSESPHIGAVETSSISGLKIMPLNTCGSLFDVETPVSTFPVESKYFDDQCHVLSDLLGASALADMIDDNTVLDRMHPLGVLLPGISGRGDSPPR